MHSLGVILVLLVVWCVIMVLNIYARKKAFSLYFQGHTVSSIVDHLCLEDGIAVSKQGLCKFLKHYTERGTIEMKQGSGCPSKITPGIQQIIENAMIRDDETNTSYSGFIWRLCFFNHHYTQETPDGLDLPRVSILPTHKRC